MEKKRKSLKKYVVLVIKILQFPLSLKNLHINQIIMAEYKLQKN